MAVTIAASVHRHVSAVQERVHGGSHLVRVALKRPGSALDHLRASKPSVLTSLTKTASGKLGEVDGAPEVDERETLLFHARVGAPPSRTSRPRRCERVGYPA